MRALVILILFFISPLANAQPDVNSPEYFLRLYSQSNGKLSPSLDKFSSFISKLENEKNDFNSDKSFLHHVFIKTHQKFLSTFEPYASFADLIEKGSYNCLTATALYGVLLQHFQISYRLIETNDHIFILCNTDKGQVLLETTDYESGFVSHPISIEKRISSYRKPLLEKTHTRTDYRGSFHIMDTVKMTGMLGLLHYNHAAKSYNDGDFKAAITHLRHGFLLHRSPRMEDFASVLVLSINANKQLPIALKQEYLEKIKLIQTRMSAWED